MFLGWRTCDGSLVASMTAASALQSNFSSASVSESALDGLSVIIRPVLASISRSQLFHITPIKSPCRTSQVMHFSRRDSPSPRFLSFMVPDSSWVSSVSRVSSALWLLLSWGPDSLVELQAGTTSLDSMSRGERRATASSYASPNTTSISSLGNTVSDSIRAISGSRYARIAVRTSLWVRSSRRGQ